MHNLKELRKNLDNFKIKFKNRNVEFDINDFKKKDALNRDLISKKEKLEQEKKSLSKLKDKSNFERSKKISQEISNLERKQTISQNEIDKILFSYQNNDLPNENRFLMIEQTINNNFAGTGIAKFVAGEAWSVASKDVKKKYVVNFKRHLALNIASMMQSYSNQKYELSEAEIDTKNNIFLIEMEIFSETGSVVVTW